MGSKLIEVDHDYAAVAKILRALHNPVASDPASPVNGEVWLNTTSGTFKYRAAGVTKVFATTDDVSAGGLSASLFDAFTILAADTDNTPAALTVGASTVVGRRSTGGIVAVTYANLKADLEALNIAAATLGGSSLATVLGRAAHTGTQAASTISDFNTAADARVAAGIAALVDAAPGTLDTLNELAAALGDDANFAATTATALGLKTESYTANFGNGAAQSFAFSHGFATTLVEVQTYRNSDNVKIECGVTITDANTVTVDTVSVPTTNAYRVHIIGRNL
jgi:hypothetical protein